MIRALTVVAALALPAPALAQAYQCTPPARVGPLRPVTPDGPVRRVPVSSYTLAVSWSPEYCKGKGRAKGQAKGQESRGDESMQCSGTNGRFGFVLHGLWPEARSGPPPQWCATTPQPSPDLIRRNLCMTPVPWLLNHEWAKHGSCMVKTPEAYYRVSGILWQSLRWPDADRLSRQKGLTVGDLRTAILAENPGWRREQVGVLLSRTGWLRELRLCYGRDFMPAACPRGSFGPPDSAGLKIWRGL